MNEAPGADTALEARRDECRVPSGVDPRGPGPGGRGATRAQTTAQSGARNSRRNPRHPMDPFPRGGSPLVPCTGWLAGVNHPVREVRSPEYGWYLSTASIPLLAGVDCLQQFAQNSRFEITDAPCQVRRRRVSCTLVRFDDVARRQRGTRCRVVLLAAASWSGARWSTARPPAAVAARLPYA